MIRLEGIRVDFGGLRAIDHASFNVDAGSVTGLIGPNGAGKTTAFNVIAGAIRPNAGRVLFDGEDITGLKPYQRAQRGLARTFQIPHEFSHLTVLENLMAAASAPEGENVFNVIFRRGRFGAEERAIYDHARETIRFLELDHVLDEKAGNLSGGQKKLVELGRALMRNPKIILLDEIGAGINRTLAGQDFRQDPAAQQGAGADLLPDRARSRLCLETLRRGHRHGSGHAADSW